MENETSDTYERFKGISDEMAHTPSEPTPVVESAPAPITTVINVTVDTKSPQFVAVSGELAGAAGVQVWIEQSGLTNVAAMTAARDAAGYDDATFPLPSPPSAKDALSRTAKDWEDRNRDVKRGKNGVFFLSTATVDDTKVEYQESAKLALDADGNLWVTPVNHPNFAEFQATFKSFRENWNTADISAWWVAMVRRLQATPIKSRGSDFFIPPDNVDRYRAISAVIAAGSAHTLPEIAMMRTSGAIQVIYRAVMRDVTESLDAVHAAVTAPIGEGKRGLNSAGLKTRIALCDDLTAKVKAYQLVTGVDMPELLDRAATLRKSLESYGTDAAQRSANWDLDSAPLASEPATVVHSAGIEIEV